MTWRALLLFVLLVHTGCDHGLAPPEAPLTGAIRGTVIYADPTAWPPQDSVRDLRFVALPFVPQDTLDLFRDLSRLVFSNPLAYGVEQQSFYIEDVEAQTYVYAGVAQHYGQELLDWRVVGLYDGDGGIFQVRPGQVTDVTVRVDFRNPPPFPP